MTSSHRLCAPYSLLAIVLPVLLFAFWCTGAGLRNSKPVDRIAAVVNEDVILRSELERAIANIRTQYAGRENQLHRPMCCSARCWNA